MSHSLKYGGKMSAKYLQFIKNRWFLAVVCLLLGAAVILGIRFATYKVDAVHYHANFALYINGQKQEFKGMQYYTDVEMCTTERIVVPSERAHMHDDVNNVVHVEDHAVTWGQFFTNLGWIMGPTNIVSPDGTVYSADNNNKLNLVINGEDYTDLGGLQNTVIKDKDKLLISFGNQNEADLKQKYNVIPSTAAKYDLAKDPAGCGSNHGPTMRDRFVHML